MDEQQTLIIETAKRIFADQCDKPVVDKAESFMDEQGVMTPGIFPQQLWDTLTQTGLTTIGVEPEKGGAGGAFSDALLVISESGAAAAPIPLVHHLIAAQLLSLAGESLPVGIMTFAIVRSEHSVSVAFSEVADWLLVVSEDALQLVKNENLDWQTSISIAGESTATLSILEAQSKLIALKSAAETAQLLGARARACSMSGAMNHVLQMSVQYVSDRVQFGRALSKFQAIQHQLAVLAGEVASAQRAADSILHEPQVLDVAIAKSRVGEAVTLVTEVAHQVHGAIGYTLEHGLNHRTRRLWQWRDEFGGERYWQEQIGRQFCRSGADELWAGITNLG